MTFSKRYRRGIAPTAISAHRFLRRKKLGVEGNMVKHLAIAFGVEG